MTPYAIVATVLDRPGILFGLTKVLAEHEANITYVDIHSGSPTSEIYFEVTLPDGRLESVMGHLRDVSGVESVREKRRRVNGTEVLMLEIDTSLRGVPLTYLGYFYGGSPGTVQLLTFTGRNLVDEFRADFEEFLNGLTVKN